MYDPEKPDELIHRSPGCSGWQQEYRCVHYGDYCAFLGYVGTRELRALGVMEEVLDDPMWDEEQKENKFREPLNGLRPSEKVWALFYCSKTAYLS